MKKYNHTNTINLKKPDTLYCSRVWGNIVRLDNILWFRDKQTGNRCCVMNTTEGKKIYTSKEFYEEYVEYVPREVELFNETQNNRKYPVDIITYDIVSEPGFPYSHSKAVPRMSVKLQGTPPIKLKQGPYYG